jgi:hypothetical protein
MREGLQSIGQQHDRRDLSRPADGPSAAYAFRERIRAIVQHDSPDRRDVLRDGESRLAGGTRDRHRCGDARPARFDRHREKTALRARCAHDTDPRARRCGWSRDGACLLDPRRSMAGRWCSTTTRRDRSFRPISSSRASAARKRTWRSTRIDQWTCISAPRRRRCAAQLDPDGLGERMECDAAAVRAASAVVRPNVAARRDRTGVISEGQPLSTYAGA